MRLATAGAGVARALFRQARYTAGSERSLLFSLSGGEEPVDPARFEGPAEENNYQRLVLAFLKAYRDEFLGIKCYIHWACFGLIWGWFLDGFGRFS